MILSNDLPNGRCKLTNRKRGDWFHSVVVLTEYDIPQNGDPIQCVIIHFHGEKGSPVLDKQKCNIYQAGIHIGVPFYCISLWSDSYAVVEKIRTDKKTYEEGYGQSDLTISQISTIAFEKWFNKIPYIHQRDESYNCIAFSDDLLYFLKYKKWNPRIIENHKKHGLVL